MVLVLVLFGPARRSDIKYYFPTWHRTPVMRLDLEVLPEIPLECVQEDVAIAIALEAAEKERSAFGEAWNEWKEDVPGGTTGCAAPSWLFPLFRTKSSWPSAAS